MKFSEMKEQCLAAGYVGEEEGVEVCGCSVVVACSGYSCPSKKYWNIGHGKQEGYHKMKALENTGLKDQYREEMLGEEASATTTKEEEAC